MVKKTGAKRTTLVTNEGAALGSGKKNTLFKKNPRNFRIGGDIQPKRDLTRFVKWPKYIRIQRQKRILMQRLKVPPTIAQFQSTIERDQASKLLKLLAKYSPETRAEKKARLQASAAAKGDKPSGPKPLHIKFGLNHVTQLVEDGTAKLVVIAHDVDPIEMVCFLPALCRKKGVPFCFVRGKANLGKLVHLKTATCLALTEVHKEDFQDFETLTKTFMLQFNENTDLRRKQGGNVMGIKNVHMMAAREKIRKIEQDKKETML